MEEGGLDGFPPCCKHLHQRLLPDFLILSNTESVIVSPFIPVYTFEEEERD